MDKEEVVKGIKVWTKWWVGQRRKKLEDELSDSMSINPFLAPFLFDYHDLHNFEEYVDLIIASHLFTGHNTGFGKLIDEKFLPNVFETTKLNARYRRLAPPFNKSCFDEIDHIVKINGATELLSLKAGKWTIQLTMAVQLNMAFQEILTQHPQASNNIVVGVFCGKKETLTDKYDILRGINRGANHQVFDLTEKVQVYAGREFWKWLSGGQHEAQEWVLEGIVSALHEEEIHKTARNLLSSYKKSVAKKYDKFLDEKGHLDAEKLLQKING
jgi:hypothetical protein